MLPTLLTFSLCVFVCSGQYLDRSKDYLGPNAMYVVRKGALYQQKELFRKNARSVN